MSKCAVILRCKLLSMSLSYSSKFYFSEGNIREYYFLCSILSMSMSRVDSLVSCGFELECLKIHENWVYCFVTQLSLF